MVDNVSGIPIIDFEGFGDGSSESARAIGQLFYAACRDVGFAYLINHGIPQDAIDDMFDWSRRFFALPLEVKMTAPHPPRGDQHRGYSAIGLEQVSQMVFDQDKLAALRGHGADFKESYDMGKDGGALNNIWIEDKYLPGFRDACTAYMSTCRGVQVMALRALAIGMPGVPDGFFDEYHSDADNQLRLLRYPAAPWEVFESGEKGRISAHTDFSTCTFLFQDQAGGLEVEDPHEPGKFVVAPPIRGAIVFNIGDFMMRWSNDDLKSTLHRVRAPPRRPEHGDMTPERFSIPYFCSANKDKVIDALPGSWNETKPKKYEPIKAGDYVNMRLRATYVER
ncbi:hypothetical protein Q5752_003843 [Cryptotrichosporon argae]